MLTISSSTYAPHLAALQRAQEAQCALGLRDAARAAAVATVDSTCLNWIRNNERPSPVLTTLIHPPAASGGIPALLGDDGRAITGGGVCYSCLGRREGAYNPCPKWARIYRLMTESGSKAFPASRAPEV